MSRAPAAPLSSRSTVADVISVLQAHVTNDDFWAKRLAALSRPTPTNRNTRIHLAVFVEPYLSFVLDGTKTVESRFSVNRCAPFEAAQEGDIVLLKKSGGEVVGLCEIRTKWFYRLNEATWKVIREDFARPLAISDRSFWKAKERASFASLFRIGNVSPLQPLPVIKRDRRGWVIFAPA